MKRSLLAFIIALVILPLQAETIYVHTETHTIHYIVNPFHHYNVDNKGVHYRRFGIRNGLGTTSGFHYYRVPSISGERSDSIMDNSGTGTHGPGTY